MSELELYRDMPGYAKLTDEQKVTTDRWDQERIRLHDNCNMLDEAVKNKDQALWTKAMDGFKDEGAAYMCEHERHWSSNCAECDMIEKILRPELYCDKDDCSFSLSPEEVEAKIKTCDCCRADVEEDEDD